MKNYKSLVVSRLKDKSSQSSISLTDKLRLILYYFKKGMVVGSHTVFKKNVFISIARGGQLLIGQHCLIHRNTTILLTLPKPKLNIGDHVYIGQDTIIASKNGIEIGDFSIFAPRCYVIDHKHGFEKNNLILNQNSILKKVKIGRDCYFGTNTTILGGVNIGDGAIVGANSVVTKDIESGEIWAGNPARFIRMR